MKLDGKIVVVTGAGNGIGRQLALELLRRGAFVAAADRNVTFLEETVRLAKGCANRLTAVPLDVTQPDEVARFPARLCSVFGTVDGLINCAGIIQPFLRIGDLDEAMIERVFAVNLFGQLRMTRAFLPHLLQRPEAHIANVASMGGVLPVPGQAIYGASKAAVKLLTEALHAELADTSVRVTVVLPGMIGTNITENSNAARNHNAEEDKRRKRTMSADQAARNILDGMEANKRRILVDMPARIMDALYRLAPHRATDLIAGQLKDKLASPQMSAAV